MSGRRAPSRARPRSLPRLPRLSRDRAAYMLVHSRFLTPLLRIPPIRHRRLTGLPVVSRATSTYVTECIAATPPCPPPVTNVGHLPVQPAMAGGPSPVYTSAIGGNPAARCRSGRTFCEDRMTNRHPSWNRLIGFSPLLEATCACGAGAGFRVQGVASGLRAGRMVRGSGWGERFARRCAAAAPTLTAAEGSAVLWAEPSPRERTAHRAVAHRQCHPPPGLNRVSRDTPTRLWIASAEHRSVVLAPQGALIETRVSPGEVSAARVPTQIKLALVFSAGATKCR